MIEKIKDFLSVEVTHSRMDLLPMAIGMVILYGSLYYFNKRLDKKIDENSKLIGKQIRLERENEMLKLELKSLKDTNE